MLGGADVACGVQPALRMCAGCDAPLLLLFCRFAQQVWAAPPPGDAFPVMTQQELVRAKRAAQVRAHAAAAPSQLAGRLGPASHNCCKHPPLPSPAAGCARPRTHMLAPSLISSRTQEGLAAAAANLAASPDDPLAAAEHAYLSAADRLFGRIDTAGDPAFKNSLKRYAEDLEVRARVRCN